MEKRNGKGFAQSVERIREINIKFAYMGMSQVQRHGEKYCVYPCLVAGAFAVSSLGLQPVVYSGSMYVPELPQTRISVAGYPGLLPILLSHSEFRWSVDRSSTPTKPSTSLCLVSTALLLLANFLFHHRFYSYPPRYSLLPLPSSSFPFAMALSFAAWKWITELFSVRTKPWPNPPDVCCHFSFRRTVNPPPAT